MVRQLVQLKYLWHKETHMSDIELNTELSDLLDYLDKNDAKKEANILNNLIKESGEKHEALEKDLDQPNADLKVEDVLDKLSKIADKLDAAGAGEQADMIDEFLLKHAAKKSKQKDSAPESMVDWQDEEDTEQSKRYDSKHHHSMQIREPKTDKERLNLEGYSDNHHVHSYQNVKEAASTRYCPEHIGITMGRVGESTFQCPLDGKMYNWEVGFTDYDGKFHSGGSVSSQTTDSSGVDVSHRIFDSRDNILNRVK